MKKLGKSGITVMIFYILLLLSPAVVRAQDVSFYQIGAYMPGMINVRDFMAPVSGLFLVDYNYWGNTRSFYGRNGEKLRDTQIDLSGRFPELGEVNINLRADIKGYLNVPFLMFAYQTKFTEDLKLAASFSPTYITGDYRVYTPLTEGRVEVQGNAAGWADWFFSPIGIWWTRPRLNLAFLYGFYAPTGRYEHGADDNIGQGFWTHVFQIATYYHRMEGALALFVMPTLELNGKLKGRDFRAANRFSLEYGVSMYFTEWLEVELMNAHNWQITGDSGTDMWWRGTSIDVRDRKNTFGAGVGIWPWQNVLQLRFKYMFDYAVRQRFKNDYFALSAFIALWVQK